MKTDDKRYFNNKKNCFPLDRQAAISFRFARWHPARKETHAPFWSVKHGVDLPPGWVIAIRLTEFNRNVLDYLLLRTTRIPVSMLRVSERSRQSRRIESFTTFDQLLRSLTGKLSRAGAASAKPHRWNPHRGWIGRSKRRR